MDFYCGTFVLKQRPEVGVLTHLGQLYEVYEGNAVGKEFQP